MTDMVDNPPHYQGSFECIRLSSQYSFCLGNAIKYVWRNNMKGDRVQDLQKARKYLEFSIEYDGLNGVAKPLKKHSEDVAPLILQCMKTDQGHCKTFWVGLYLKDYGKMLTALDRRIKQLESEGDK